MKVLPFGTSSFCQPVWSLCFSNPRKKNSSRRKTVSRIKKLAIYLTILPLAHHGFACNQLEEAVTTHLYTGAVLVEKTRVTAEAICNARTTASHTPRRTTATTAMFTDKIHTVYICILCSYMGKNVNMGTVKQRALISNLRWKSIHSWETRMVRVNLFACIYCLGNNIFCNLVKILNVRT